MGAYSTSTGEFTPTIAGYYEVSFSLFLTGTAPTPALGYPAVVEVYKNGSPILAGGLYYFPANIPTQAISNVSGIVQLNGSTDYLSFYGYTSLTPATLFAGFPFANFASAFLIDF